ncbi:UDP-glucuronic acid decarboxylase family protein [Halobaculum lipolyticum]|uniref:UDP-glucuronic acid decarboxylase family protein n=1 Tax=Halobaculum lipolyticum TaxID=3032001 RepID=A0ABD5WCW8_9EURY|nr:UDP-glucuronic acid decarboxylase family protein [Halobaculum sp. DT31]
MTTRTLVAGGAGFLGSHLCERLLADGHRVYCLDNESSGRAGNVEHLLSADRFEYVRGDVRDLPELPDVDEVYNLASRASPTDFDDHPVEIALTNAEGTRNLLDYCVDRDATFLFASTSEVYGDPEVHPQPESYNGNVNVRGVRGCYDESKRFGEALVVAYERQYGVDARTARIFNTYGPRMRPDDGRVVPTFVRQALAGDDLTVYGDGSQTRSFCYVDDEVAGLRALMDEPTASGAVVNLGNDREITIREFAETVIDVLGDDNDIVYEPLPEDDPQRRRPDSSRARDLLGWTPEIGLEEGLRRTGEFFAEAEPNV